MMLQSSHKKLLGFILFLAVVAGLGYFLYYAPSTTVPSVVVPPPGEVALHGQVVCLPHIDTSGPQTMECAFGFKDDAGRYFSLHDSDPMGGLVGAAPMDKKVTVSGTFTPQESDRYQSVGVIDVLSIVPDGEPIRMTLSGTYVCLPHTDTGPQTMECAFGIKTDDGSYYGLDFNLMSQTMPTLKTGDTLKASGVLTPIERLSTDHWKKYPIKGIFSVTDSLAVTSK